MRWLYAVLLGGCAVAGKGNGGFNNGGSDSGIVLLDSSGSNNPGPDAKVWLDAPPSGMTNVTLAETTNNTIASGMGLACGGCQSLDSPCSDYRTTENAYYRVFKLSDYGVTSTLHVTQVDFGVQEASGTQSAQVRIGTYNGTPTTTINVGANDWAGGLVTAIQSTTVTIPATSAGETVSAPITGDVDPTANLIVEVFSPTHINNLNTYFFIAGTASAEQRPGFVRAPTDAQNHGCGITTPTTPASISQTSKFIITVSGTY